ncbi:MAG: 2-oxo acid dehydrogenase subunit E2 [Clostridiales bacterium]|nr:2-oxo acid dehydrogenase subunit E2 [Clostridiales bacterium]
MANLVLMPQLGISDDSAVIAKWHIKAGDTVKRGDRLFSIETGKATFDVESEHGGTVLAMLAEEGEEKPVGAPVCAIGDAGELFEAVGDDGLPVSPRARALAERAGINPKRAAPTGPGGRVIERDVLKLLDNQEDAAFCGEAAHAKDVDAPLGYTDRPLSKMRKIIAENMTVSLRNTAQLTHTASFDAAAIIGYRKLLKADPLLSGITLTDMVSFAVTRTLPQFPELNAHLHGDTMRCFSDVNLACAVDTERGLMTPVVFGASKLTLLEMSKQLKGLAEACRRGSIASELLTGGSFTVSSLGQFGIESFTPILNPPQTGILGVNAITTRVREENGAIKAYPCMALSLTYDHRAIDGAPASKFLQALCRNLEAFTSLLEK